MPCNQSHYLRKGVEKEIGKYLVGILPVVKIYSPAAHAANITVTTVRPTMRHWYRPNWPTSSTSKVSKETPVFSSSKPILGVRLSSAMAVILRYEQYTAYIYNHIGCKFLPLSIPSNLYSGIYESTLCSYSRYSCLRF